MVWNKLRPHWPVGLLAVVALAVILLNLGSGCLWADEGDTAVLASNILKFGVPTAWDGSTFMDSDFGARENEQLIMVSSPWLQYYVAAGSFFLFGKNTFAARLPFALAGWITILLVYYIVWRTTKDQRAAFCSAVLTMSSVQFLLYCRESRYYSLATLLTCALVALFLELKSGLHTVLFVLVGVLLFHAHPIGIVTIGTLAILTLAWRQFVPFRRPIFSAIPVICIFTLPWFIVARTGYAENALLVPSLRDFFARFFQYLIECGSITPLVGIVVVGAVVLARKSKIESPVEGDRAANLLLVIFALFASYCLAIPLTQRTAALWVTGIRYTPAIIPLLAMATGILIVKAGRGRRFLWLPLLLLFGFTNVGTIMPWLFLTEKTSDPENKFVAAHVPMRLIDRFVGTGQLLFLRDLFEPNPGTVSDCVAFLVGNAKPGDLVITNYESEPLYFHTRLPQGMKIMRQDPVYEIARRRGLPDYVFGAEGSRWIVWRFNWDNYLGINWAAVQSRLLEEDAKVERVATIKETAWENRENIHFHRFAGDLYLFPQDNDRPPAAIFRVDWPAP